MRPSTRDVEAWSTAIRTVGVPSVIALALVGFLAWRLDAKVDATVAAATATAKAMDAANAAMTRYVEVRTRLDNELRQHELRMAILAWQTCINTSRTADARVVCDVGREPK